MSTEDSNATTSIGSQNPDDNFDSFSRLPTEVVEILIYLLCLCTGGPLNVICFGRLFRLYVNDRRNRNQILLLRLHLNIADLLTIFIYTPTQIIWMSTFQWYGGDLLCRICKFFYTFSFYLNSFVIAAIAVDRAQGAYRIKLVLCDPKYDSIKALDFAFRRVKYTLIFSYIAATIFSIPQIFIFRVFQPSLTAEFRQCAPLWTIYAYQYELKMQAAQSNPEKYHLTNDYLQVHRLEKMYNITHLLLVFWIPTTIVACSYIFVISGRTSFIALFFSSTNATKRYSDCSGNAKTTSTGDVCNDGELSAENAFSALESGSAIGPLALQTLSKASKIAKRQAAMILLAYLSLWSPYNVLAMMNTLASHSQNREIILDTLPFLNALIVVNTVVNPLIYSLFQRH